MNEILKDSWILKADPSIHVLEEIAAKKQTCSEDGNKKYFRCTLCEKLFSDENCENETTENDVIIPSYGGHNWGKATYTWSSDNKKVTATCYCTNIKSHKKTETVKTTVSTKAATCKTAGKTTYTATFKSDGFAKQTKSVAIPKTTNHKFGDYRLTKEAKKTASGLLTSTCSVCGKKKTMVVTPTIAKAVSSTGTKAVVSWGKVNGATRYKVYLTTCKGSKTMNERHLVATTTGTSFTKTGLKKNTFYKFCVKAERKIDGKWTVISTSYYGHFVSGNTNDEKTATNIKSISVKNASVTVKKGKTATIAPSYTLAKTGKNYKVLSVADHCATFRYASRNTAIAKVSSSGVITGVKAGTCKIYVIGTNGVSKVINVTVK